MDIPNLFYAFKYFTISLTLSLKIIESTIADTEYTIISDPKTVVKAKDPICGLNIIIIPHAMDKIDKHNTKNQLLYPQSFKITVNLQSIVDLTIIHIPITIGTKVLIS